MKELFLPILCSMLFASCSKTTTEGGGGLPASNILLENAIFDINGNASLNGWTYAPSDVDSVASFTNDVPPGSSAKWSLALSPGWIPSTEYVYRNFIGLTGGVYKLSLWAKVIGSNQGGGGVLISSSPLQPWKPSALLAVTDTSWKQITLFDTLTLRATDTTSIVFTGGSTEVANWGVLYNNITFEKLP